MIHVLNYEKVQPSQQLAYITLVDPRMSCVGRNNPKSSDRPRPDSFDDFAVGPTRSIGNVLFRNGQGSCDLASMIFVGEVPSAKKVCRVAEESRSHGIALAGDGICAGPWPPHISRHQSNVDDRLCGANAFVALVDAHGPPE